jgi:signal transduction histidine kinase
MRYLTCGSLVVLLAAGWGFDSAGAEELGAVNSLVLTNAAQIRALTAEQAAKRVPVSLQGSVVMIGGAALSLVDGTAGIFMTVPTNDSSKCHRGDVIQVDGVTDAGRFAPCVIADHVKRAGVAGLPVPRPATFDEFVTGRLDAQWVEISGVVRRSSPLRPGSDDQELWLATGGGQLLVRLSKKQAATASPDSEVQIRGVCFYQFNTTRQALNPILVVHRDDPVIMISQAPADPYAVQPKSIGSLMQFSAEGAFGRRLRVQGVVIHSEPGAGFWIRGGDHGLRVNSRQKEPLAVGMAVDVLGFVSRGEYSPILEDAVFQERGVGPLPQPVFLASATNALDHDSDLVELDAVIRDQWLAMDGCRLELTAGVTRFPALLRTTGKTPIPREWISGSRVRVAGICSVNVQAPGGVTGTLVPQSFQILLRSPADLTVLLQPPLWTSQRISWVLGSVVALLLLALAGIVWNGRRRLRAEAQAYAIERERVRIAQDIHDDLGASLTHIKLLGELVEGEKTLDGVFTHTRKVAETAGAMVRALDEIVWAVRPQNDTLERLVDYLGRVAEEFFENTGVRCRLNLPAPVPACGVSSDVRHNLFLAFREALNNVSKHAGATEVRVDLAIELPELRLTITDDGKGFDPAAVRAGRNGLTNLRQRLEEIGGHCEISSRQGEGTKVDMKIRLKPGEKQ